MTRAEAVAFFEEQQGEWATRDADALTRRYTADGTIISPMFRTVHGRDAIHQSYRTLFTTFPDWEYLGDAPLVDGDRIAQPFIVHATHSGDFFGLPGSGRAFEITGVRMFEIRDGLIAWERRLYDFTGLLIQLGVLRGKPVRSGS